MSKAVKIWKYCSIFIGLISIMVCIYCMFDEIQEIIGNSKLYTQMVFLFLTIVHFITGILLLVGCFRLRHYFLAPWLLCLPLTILDNCTVICYLITNFWGVVLSLLISVGMWLVPLELFLKLLKKQSQSDGTMQASSAP